MTRFDARRAVHRPRRLLVFEPAIDLRIRLEALGFRQSGVVGVGQSLPRQRFWIRSLPVLALKVVARLQAAGQMKLKLLAGTMGRSLLARSCRTPITTPL